MEFATNTNDALFHNQDQFSIDEDMSIDYEIIKCRALWRAIITQALMDAASNSKKAINKKNKIKAIQWLKSNNADFDMVCHLADLNPNYVKSKVKHALSQGCKWRQDKRKKNPISI